MSAPEDFGDRTQSTEAKSYLETLVRTAEILGLDPGAVVEPHVRSVTGGAGDVNLLSWPGGPGRPALFLHGIRQTAHTWDPVCLSTVADRPCVAMDLRGHGQSDWSVGGQYELADHRSDLARVLETVRQPVHLAGLSLGGLVALALTAVNGAKVASLTIIDIGPRTRTAGRMRLRQSLKNDLVEPSRSVEESVRRAVATSARDPELLEFSLRHSLIQDTSGAWRWRYDPRSPLFRSPRQRIVMEQNLWAAVDDVECPALIVRGSRSDVFSDRNAQKLAMRFKAGRWVRIDGAGHSVPGDRPLPLAQALAAFWREIDLRSGIGLG